MSTSKLQKYVSRELGKRMGKYSIYENTRPSWLGGLELDFYMPEISIAIEVQGKQHFCFSGLFHKSKQDFEEQIKRDQEKKIICYNLGIVLYEIFSEMDADILIIDLYNRFSNKNKISALDDEKETKSVYSFVAFEDKEYTRLYNDAAYYASVYWENQNNQTRMKAKKHVMRLFDYSQENDILVENMEVCRFYNLIS